MHILQFLHSIQLISFPFSGERIQMIHILGSISCLSRNISLHGLGAFIKLSAAFNGMNSNPLLRCTLIYMCPWVWRHSTFSNQPFIQYVLVCFKCIIIAEGHQILLVYSMFGLCTCICVPCNIWTGGLIRPHFKLIVYLFLFTMAWVRGNKDIIYL